jgi:protein tyrosine phosphatase
MIWQENVKNIIMLTELIEKGQAKSEKYWPEPQIKRRFGKILIENVVEKIFSDYIHRQFNIKCENEVRQVHHFQYTTWPDHGVPLYPQNFTPFMKRLLAAPQQNSPIVVHCNAGCGRTGTLILCDIVLRMAAREKKVDFVKVLLKMRTQRCNLVNNVKQYIFAHFVVLECLFRADFSIPVNDAFQDEVFKVLRKISVKPLMEELDKVTEQFYRQNKKPRQLTDANKKKNRFPTILPGHSQVYLPTSSETPSNYINAVCVDCYRCPKKFIVTQQPLPDTVQDFWRLIKGYEINTIVSLNDIEENDPNCPEFWSVHDDSTKLHVLDVIDDRVYKITKLKIVDMVNRSNEKTVNILKMKNWKRDTPKPVNIKDLIVVWKEMFNSSWKGDSQIVITCYDGATASGLFVALAHLLEKINYEQICDVFSAARTVRQGREEFVQDWVIIVVGRNNCGNFLFQAQIEFLYKAAKVYVEEFDNYDNFNE